MSVLSPPSYFVLHSALTDSLSFTLSSLTIQLCKLKTPGVPLLSQHPYEYSSGVESNHDYSQHHSVNVENNAPYHHPQSSPQNTSPSLSVSRGTNNSSALVQSPNPTESGEHSHYSFHSAVSVPNSPYPHHVNNPSTYYYHRQENASYISSPNPQPMSLNSSLPYISKMSQMPSTSRRQNMSPPSHELLPISNRSRLQSPGLSTRYGNMSLIKSDSPDPGPEIPRPPKPEASNAPQCTAFISKLYHLCGHAEYRPYIRWNGPGDAFVLAHANTEFATTILPKFFRHNNVSSFIRQLNLYSFTRLPTIKLLDQVDNTQTNSSTSAFSGFSHPNFRRGDENSLSLIKPKPNKNKGVRKAIKCASSMEDKFGKPGRKNISGKF
ncbi:hypothetical protein PCANC_13566 [Puccinia coronata f. sp. avenae]|uniref:HSF-type DNA-binding domain-containing protein n=1 Tax=Puccinia coronata f. sp. avenae TaxID=200324 RepID=A0A2N5UCQ5_9BASI|nr:hypothetical protein PCANC_20842 [Puccinia coronata f. sp. avenae]PLW35157.1 hypothetical protein PCASD_11241 [Puccinia coronata f. sp. avenae]PLW35519.1 hypothetical protein PCANC_13566 [Puccinia coronata f. sp. avenae]